MDPMLDTLALIAGIVGAGVPTGTSWIEKTQADLDHQCKQVAVTKATDHAAPVHPWFRVVNIDPAVERFQIQRAVLPPSGSLDVYVDVVQSAQQGSLYLNLGGETLESLLYLEVAGRWGVESFSFLSGTTIQTVANAITSQWGLTGAKAFAGASGVTLQSAKFGHDAYVTVRVVDSGGLQAVAPEVGIYRAQPDNANHPDPATHIPIDSVQAYWGVHDRGQDIQGIINGWSRVGQGTVVWINHPRLKLRVDLAAGPLEPGMTANAQNPGIFRAFTLVRWP